MSEQPRHPLLARALDRSLPLEERRAAYARWAESHSRHGHPGRGWHAHAGGDRYHAHPKEDPR